MILFRDLLKHIKDTTKFDNPHCRGLIYDQGSLYSSKSITELFGLTSTGAALQDKLNSIISGNIDLNDLVTKISKYLEDNGVSVSAPKVYDRDNTKYVNLETDMNYFQMDAFVKALNNTEASKIVKADHGGTTSRQVLVLEVI